VRFLPNPHFVPALRRLTGRSATVRRFIRSFPFFRKRENFYGAWKACSPTLMPQLCRRRQKLFKRWAFSDAPAENNRSVMLAEEIRKSAGEAEVRNQSNSSRYR